MWCEHCNRQYDDEFETCLVCGAKLQDYTPILTEEEREILDLPQEKEDNELSELQPPEEILPELLVTVAGEEEARRLAALLEGLKIPCLCRPAQEEEESQEILPEEDLFPEEFPEEEEFVTEEELFNLLVPKMLVRKALRVLHEDEARQEERQALLEKQEQQKTEAALQPETEEKEGKPKKKWFGLFGKK